jgi:tetratricopeptide (TPR) repeat protein
MVYTKKISLRTRNMKKYLLFTLIVLVGFTAMAQDEGDDEGEDDAPTACANKYGLDSIETVKNLSLFNMYYKEKKYVESFPYWEYLFINAPCIQKRITFSGPYIIKKVLREEEYKSRFNGLVDTLLLTHDKRIEFFGQEGYVLGKKADDLAKLVPSRRGESLVIFKKSVELTADKTKFDVPKDYIYAGVKEHMKEKIILDDLFVILDEVTPIIDQNIAKYTMPGISAKDSIMGTKWVQTQNDIIGMMKPYLSCDKLTELKEPAFTANAQNITWLKSTIKLLDRGGCESGPFYLKCTEALFALEPSSDAALSLAKAFSRKGDDSKAVSYYNKAADLATTDEAKYDIYIKLAKTAKNNSQFSTVRDYARKALSINPNSGEAYLLIGDAYAASASSCGGDLGRGGVYLVAVDKYVKARSVDASVAGDANTKIAKWSAYFPDKESAFFKGITAGSSYTVGCWIGESTSVRFAGG